MEKVYHKLVRDNIPSIIGDNNEIAITRILSDDEYRTELYKKLLEECNELICAKTTNSVIEEAADVFEVLKSISELEDKKIDEVIEYSKKKKLRRGGFTKKIFLEKTLSKR